MQPMNQQATLEGRYRTLVILWFALFTSIGLFFLLTILVSSTIAINENRILSSSLLVVGTVTVIASYFIKKRFLAQSVNEQNIVLVQTGMVVAAALTEVPALLGLMDYFVTGNPYYYVLMIIAVVGSLLNFPRRAHLLAASYKSSQPKDPWR